MFVLSKIVVLLSSEATHYAAQEKSSQEGQIEFYGFFPTVANKTYTRPVKNQAPLE